MEKDQVARLLEASHAIDQAKNEIRQVVGMMLGMMTVDDLDILEEKGSITLVGGWSIFFDVRIRKPYIVLDHQGIVYRQIHQGDESITRIHVGLVHQALPDLIVEMRKIFPGLEANVNGLLDVAGSLKHG
jgi:hypothetical protein